MVGVRNPVGAVPPVKAAVTDDWIEVQPAPTIDLEGVEIADLRQGAHILARIEVADAVSAALRADGRSLREIGRATGLEAADLSRLARGKKGATVASLALIALALGKSLRISIE